MPVPGLRDPRILLAAWEAAAGMPAVARAAVLVAHDRPGSQETVLDLPLAQCASLAAGAYADTFGSQADGSCTCGSCGEVIDVPLDMSDYAGSAPDAGGWVADEIVTAGGGTHTLTVRALTTRDLLAAGAAPDPATALWRCCVRDGAGQALAPEDLAALGADDVAALDAAADRLAGVASVLLRMRCPGCGEDITAPLDPGTLLWERVEATVPRLLAEVAALARAFGWAEDAVLALSTARRRAYLDLAGEPAWEV